MAMKLSKCSQNSLRYLKAEASPKQTVSGVLKKLCRSRRQSVQAIAGKRSLRRWETKDLLNVTSPKH